MDLSRVWSNLCSLRYFVFLLSVMTQSSQQSLVRSDLYSVLTSRNMQSRESTHLKTLNKMPRRLTDSLMDQLLLLNEYIAAIDGVTSSPGQSSHTQPPHHLQKVVKKEDYSNNLFVRPNRGTTGSMTLVQTRYETFYGDLSNFSTHLFSHLDSSAPVGLSNVLVLKYIMTPSDRAFASLDERMVTQKFYLIHDIVFAILQRVTPFLSPASIPWFEDQQFTLEFDMFMLKGPIQDLQVDGITGHDVSVVDGGAGGINKKVQSSIGPDVLTKLQELITTLQSMPQVPIS